MDLNEELTPREHAELRESVVTGVGRLRAARARRSRIVAGVAAAALVAVVVTAVVFTTLRQPDRIATPIETPGPTATRASSPTNTPSATPTPVTPSRPSIAFQDSCDAVASSSDLEGLWGSMASFDTLPQPNIGVRTVGGLSCNWRFADGTTLNTSAFPASSVASSFVDSYTSVRCESLPSLGSGCRQAVQDSRTWLLITVGGDVYQGSDGFDEAAVKSRLADAVVFFRSALDRAGTSAAAVATAGWWPPQDCTNLAERLPLEDLLGSSSFEVGYPGDSRPDVDVNIAQAQGQGTECRWWVPGASPTRAMMIMIYPGGAWDWDRVATRTPLEWETRTPVGVDGAVDAFGLTSTYADGVHDVHATDGVNIVRVHDAPDPVVVAAAVLAALH